MKNKELLFWSVAATLVFVGANLSLRELVKQRAQVHNQVEREALPRNPEQEVSNYEVIKSVETYKLRGRLK